MRRLLWIVLPLIAWVAIVMIGLLFEGLSWKIITYTVIDTIWWFRSPSFPDYAELVFHTDLVLVFFGSAGFVFCLTNIAYNIHYRVKHIKGFICGCLVGLPLIVSSLNLLQVIDSTCFPMQGIVSTLDKETQLLYCGATNSDNALSMIEIFYGIVWTNLVLGVSLIAGSLMLITYNLLIMQKRLIRA